MTRPVIVEHANVLHLAKDWSELLDDTETMLAERILIEKPVAGAGMEATRASLRDLYGAMIATLLGGGGVDEMARLASDAIGAPVAIVVLGFGAAIEPVGAAGPRELKIFERRVRETLQEPGSTGLERLVAEVPVVHGGRRVGLVGVFSAGTDEGVDRRVDCDTVTSLTSWILDTTAAAVLTALAIEDARIETEHRLRGSFLEQLRSGDALSGTEVIRRAARLGCDVSGGAVMLCVEVEGTHPRSVALGIADEHPGAFAQAIEPADGGLMQVWAILPALAEESDDVAAETLQAAKRLATRLRQHGAVGLSRFHADPTEFSLALDEAALMLDVMRKTAVPLGEEIVDGTYKLLFRLLASHPDELSSYHATTIAPLVAHDEQYRTDLVRTLEVYLDTNCNMNVTADTIFAHRHTVAHRLERINELTGLDPTIHEDREQLGLGLKIHRLTG